MQPPAPPQRFPEIDVLRTIAIVMMVVYHLTFDLHAFAGWAVNPVRGFWHAFQVSTASIFLLIAGVSFMLQREKMLRRHTMLKTMAKRWFVRSMTILFWAMVITAATYVFDPSTFIRFGILHMIAFSILLLPLFVRFGLANFLIGVLMIIAGILIEPLTVQTSWFLPIGLTPPVFSSLDYFPLLPWFGVTLIGAAFAQLLYIPGTQAFEWWSAHRRRIDARYKKSKLLRAVAVPGKHSLAIYLVHQPVLLGGLMLAKKFIWKS